MSTRTKFFGDMVVARATSPVTSSRARLGSTSSRMSQFRAHAGLELARGDLVEQRMLELSAGPSFVGAMNAPSAHGTRLSRDGTAKGVHWHYSNRVSQAKCLGKDTSTWQPSSRFHFHWNWQMLSTAGLGVDDKRVAVLAISGQYSGFCPVQLPAILNGDYRV